MAASRSSCLTFVTRLALIFVVTLGVTGKNLIKDVSTPNEVSAVARSSRSVDVEAPYGACPVEKGYVLYDNHCLKLYSVKQDYLTAKMRCQSDEAHLFDLKSRAMDVPPLVYLLDTMGVVLPSVGNVWVGANDIEVEGHFAWSDRTPLTRDTGLWFSGQPDDSYSNEDCVEVGLSNSVIGLNDLYCTWKRAYVCQIDMKKE